MATSFRNGDFGAATAAASEQSSAAARLASFLPAATAIRIPVTAIFATGRSESTTLEYGTAREVIFRASAEIPFGATVRLLNEDGSFDAQASVVAVQYANGERAVAARFLGSTPNWIIKQ